MYQKNIDCQKMEGLVPAIVQDQKTKSVLMLGYMSPESWSQTLEKGLETALEAAAGPDERLISESADLMYHLLVLLQARGLSMSQVERELERRHRS